MANAGDILLFAGTPAQTVALTDQPFEDADTDDLLRAIGREWKQSGCPHGERLDQSFGSLCLRAAMHTGRWVYDPTLGAEGGFVRK